MVVVPGAGGSRWVLGLAQLESVRCAVSSGRVGPGSGPRFCRFTQSGLSLRWSKRRRKRKDAAQAPTCTCTCSPRALPTLESRTRVRTTARCQSRAYSGTCDTNRTHISTTTAPHCNFVANTVLSHVLILIYLPTRVLSLALSLPAGVAIVSHPPTTQQVTISRPAVDHSAHTDLPHNLISAPPALHTHTLNHPSNISRHNRAANTWSTQWSRLPMRPSRSAWQSPSSSSEGPRPAQTFADAHNKPKMDRPQCSEVC